MQKKKRVNKTKKELLQESQRHLEVARRKTRVKVDLLPLLNEKTESIEDAQIFCSSMIVAVKQAFNQKMLDTKIGDLDLISKLNPSTPQYDKYKTALELFSEETLPAFIEMWEGMPDAINAELRKEIRSRKLSELTIEL